MIKALSSTARTAQHSLQAGNPPSSFFNPSPSICTVCVYTEVRDGVCTHQKSYLITSRQWAMVNDIHGFEGLLTCDDGVCLEWVIVHLSLGGGDWLLWIYLLCGVKWIKVCGGWNLMVNTLCLTMGNKMEINIPSGETNSQFYSALVCKLYQIGRSIWHQSGPSYELLVGV